MKDLPISIQTFQGIREENFIYVDKTQFVHELARKRGSCFLSRPRRFGKSLLLNTFKSLFQGKKELFEGLFIYDKWDWSQTFPVIHFSFDALDYHTQGLDVAILKKTKFIAKEYKIKLEEENFKDCFEELIQKLHAKYGKVVFLVDEYDKPIIDFLEYEENGVYTQAVVNQKIMKQFYSVLKSSEEYIQFSFITGISKFSKVSIFSDLNHLKDISMANEYTTIVGYTQQELETYFEEHLTKVEEKTNLNRADLLAKMKYWYNGFSWDGIHKVYNPFGILNFLDDKDFQNYWFTTATPTFLLNQMKLQNIYDFENTKTSRIDLDSYDINDLRLVPLLFQTGYLTVKERHDDTYTLDYPNKEVRESMYQFMINHIAPNQRDYAFLINKRLVKAIQSADLEGVRKELNTLLSHLPSEAFDKKSEGLYHGLLHFVFMLLGMYVKSEVHSSRGRADSIVETATHVFIFEFKFNRSSREAMQQIKNNKYAAPYQLLQKTVLGIGVNFVTKEKEIQGWEVEELN
ncbi:MAG: hypothetical protein RLZZ292_3423 [Bacteroidota bacterium]|jgi:hypothetical protein